LVFIGINGLCGWAVGINGLKTTRFSVLGKRIRRCAYSCTPHNLTLSHCRV
jgi:hypothetical protein